MDEYIKKQTLIDIFKAKADMALGTPKEVFFSVVKMIEALPAAKEIIVPPCKVGDTVFVVSQGAGFSVVWNVYEAKVTDIHIDRWGKLSICVKTARTEIGGYCDTENVFHTREEAEKALAERSEE